MLVVRKAASSRHGNIICQLLIGSGEVYDDVIAYALEVANYEYNQ